MIEVRLTYKAKKLLKELYKKEVLNVPKGYGQAANELGSHGFITGANTMKNGLCGTMILTDKGRIYYLSNPSLRNRLDWKTWLSILVSVAIALIGWFIIK